MQSDLTPFLPMTLSTEYCGAMLDHGSLLSGLSALGIHGEA